MNDLGDLVLQFDATEAGREFVDAWRRARIIVDTGSSPGSTPEPGKAPAPKPASAVTSAG